MAGGRVRPAVIAKISGTARRIVTIGEESDGSPTATERAKTSSSLLGLTPERMTVWLPCGIDGGIE